MSRWFSIFVLQYFVYLISCEEGRDSLLTRSIHPRRHKRAEQEKPNLKEDVRSSSTFFAQQVDPKCKVEGRVLMSCPKANNTEAIEQTICIEASELCDDNRDCPNGEDEDPTFCMFKKLEDAEIARIEHDIQTIGENNGRKQQFKEVIVNVDEEPTREALIPSGKAGVYKLPSGHKDPFSRLRESAGLKAEESVEDDDDDTDSDENEEEEVDVKSLRRKLPARKQRRSLRHFYQLRALRL